MPLERVILFISLIYLSSNVLSCPIDNFTRNWIIEDEGASKLFGMHSISLKNNVFIYQELDHVRYYDRNTGLRSILYYEVFHNDGTVNQYKCRVELQSQYPGRISDFIIRTYKENKIWISYYNFLSNDRGYDVYLYHRIIDMITCNYHENKVYVELQWDNYYNAVRDPARVNPSIIPFADGSYDIFFSNISNYNVCYAARCRYSVDATGHMSNKSMPYLPKIYSSKHIEFYPTALKDHYYAIVKTLIPTYSSTFGQKVTSYDLSLMYVRPGGKFEELIKLDNEKRLYDIDATPDSMVICWTIGSTSIQCKQYNADVSYTLTTTFEFPYSKKSMKVKIVPQGGYILLTEECIRHFSFNNPSNTDICKDGSTYNLRYIQSNGEMNSVIDLKGSKLSDKISIDGLDISFDENNHMCLIYTTKEQVTGFNYSDNMVIKRLTKQCFHRNCLIPNQRSTKECFDGTCLTPTSAANCLETFFLLSFTCVLFSVLKNYL